MTTADFRSRGTVPVVRDVLIMVGLKQMCIYVLISCVVFITFVVSFLSNIIAFVVSILSNVLSDINISILLHILYPCPGIKGQFITQTVHVLVFHGCVSSSFGTIFKRAKCSELSLG